MIRAGVPRRNPTTDAATLARMG